jgi:hypothetical protein
MMLSKGPGVNVTLFGIAGWSTGSFGVICSSWWSCWFSCCSGGGVVFSDCAGISLSPLLLLFLESTDSPSLMSLFPKSTDPTSLMSLIPESTDPSSYEIFTTSGLVFSARSLLQ